MIENKICEGTECLNAALSSGVTSLYVLIASASGVGWGSNEAVTLLYLIPCPSAHMYSMQTQGSENFWSLPLTRISIDIADGSLLLLLFLKSLNILLGCHIINIHPCHQDMKL